MDGGHVLYCQTSVELLHCSSKDEGIDVGHYTASCPPELVYAVGVSVRRRVGTFWGNVISMNWYQVIFHSVSRGESVVGCHDATLCK